MDVGLNNRNMFEDEDLKDVVFLVDTSWGKDTFSLWQEWSREYAEKFGYKKIPNIPGKDITHPHLADIDNYIQLHNKKVDEDLSHRVDWDSLRYGISLQIGTLDDRPICIQFTFVRINGHKIAFYEGSSQLVDHKMIEDWLIERFQRTNDGYARWNHVNSTNFHNCVNSLDRMDIKPRNTTYKK